ncbi:hypothetical protein ABIB25_001811 [Nakamurella sp. UYEF19]
MGILVLLVILVALALAALSFAADTRGGREYSVGALLTPARDDNTH